MNECIYVCEGERGGDRKRQKRERERKGERWERRGEGDTEGERRSRRSNNAQSVTLVSARAAVVCPRKAGLLLGPWVSVLILSGPPIYLVSFVGKLLSLQPPDICPLKSLLRSLWFIWTKHF